MVRHIVFMKFKPETGDDRITPVEKGLGALPGLIAEIRSFEFGRDVVRSDRSYDFALVAGFDDMEALSRYQVHPEHQKVVGLLKEICQDIKAVDYEV
ncbi:stress responsive alpha-beta barrel domain-conta ining protein [Desulfonema ishimotonii]|uniref:Stress responsive alpha-beta barrel domain-conta ining protein n=1 Tax=Desulfonema ishimotonii TaxID=45657 RepID=A0A401G0Z0_9BACT|nr:Dabb family protein [Desulfonema ishimotonii]GBC62875.1 stress responsive alpha-beta barrel domain-conta ining protein [Desulfonema ishimotonii]